MGSLDRKVLLGCLAALAIFLLVGCFSYFKTQDFMATSRQVMQFHQITEDLVGILRDIADAKSSQRDFILSGKDSFLQACQDSLFSIDGKVREIRKLSREDGGLQSKLAALNSLLVEQIEFFKQTIAIRRDAGFNQAVQMIQGAQGLESMNRIQQMASDLQEEEKDLSSQQEMVMQQKSFEITRAFWIGFCADFTLLLLVYLMIHREMKGRQKAEKELSEKSGLMEMILNNMKDGVIAVDISGRFTVVNPAAQKLLGVGMGKMPALEQWPLKIDIRHAETRHPFKVEELPLNRVLKGQECENEEIFVRHDESPEGLFLAVNGRPLKDKEGSLIGGISVYTDRTEKRRIEMMILRDNQSLKHALEKMEQQNYEITMLVNLVESLQACLSVVEVARTSAKMMQSMFPDTAGCILAVDHANSRMETVGSFGGFSPSKEAFPLDECWAMRRSQVHWVNSENSSLSCQHLQEPFTKEYLCVPLAAQGRLVGMFHVGAQIEGKLQERQKKLAVLIGEQVALAFANLGLRETLQNQSIRDPLTGLFNRRYLEQFLEKEISRAKRNSRKLSALMMDIDHFKDFNDKYGHEAGDVVLLEVGSLLNKSIRKSDMACRYGGEELVLVFPETGPEEAKRLASKVRDSIKRLTLNHLNSSLGPVTVSIGVAVWPDDGKTVTELIRAADIALYQAKANGRDAVVAWRDVPHGQALPKLQSPGLSSEEDVLELILDGDNGNSPVPKEEAHPDGNGKNAKPILKKNDVVT